jgi:hypothetical protein
MSKVTSVLMLMLAVATIIAFMTAFAIPKSSPNITADVVNYRPALWRVY